MPNAQQVESPLLVPQEKVLCDGSAKLLGLLPHERHQLIQGVGRRVFHSVQVSDAKGSEIHEKLGLEPQLVLVDGERLPWRRRF